MNDVDSVKIATASGESLDALGELVGAQPRREGESDHLYRTYILRLHARVANRPREAPPWSDAPITMALCSLLGDCRPAEIVERVRNMKFELAVVKGKQFAYHDHLTRLRVALDVSGASPAEGTLLERIGDLARRLEAAELDRAGLVAKTDTLRRERDDVARKLGLADLYRAGLVASQLDRAEAERDDFKTYLDDANKTLSTIAGHVAPLGLGDVGDKLEDVVGRVVAALKAAKPTRPAVEWRGRDLFANGEFASGLVVGQPWRLLLGTRWIGHATDEASARRLAELLAGHDPGGVWRVAGEPVTVAVVRAVCPTVAVSWGPA